MSCGCNSSGSELPTQNLTSNLTPAYHSPLPGDCESTSGKFYDRMTDSFVVPQVGKESYIFVCEANRWMIGQYVAVDLGNNTIAAFKITGRTSKKIKVLNGCDRSGNNPILGNPDPGTVIPVNSTIYAIAPYGCQTGDAQRIIRILETHGVDAILNILQDSTAVCFNNVPSVSEEEEVHLFGGTRPDCDCAPGGFISSCFRKVLKIFTGQAGRTICMPEAAVVDLDPVGGIPKRMALFDTNGCLKKGPSFQEFDDCGNFGTLSGESFDNIIICDGGERKILPPSALNQTIRSVSEEVEGETIYKWEVSQRNYAIIQHKVDEGISGGTTAPGLDNWADRTINQIVQQSGSFVTLSSNIFTISEPGIYSVEWIGVIQAGGGAQIRLISADDSTNAYYGNVGFTQNDTPVCGQAVITVGNEVNNRWKFQYRVNSSFVNGLGRPSTWGPGVFFSAIIKPL